MIDMLKTRVDASALAELFREVERYLSAVALFRAEGCEPTWIAEGTAGLAAGAPGSA
jgi:hypothetical protein